MAWVTLLLATVGSAGAATPSGFSIVPVPKIPGGGLAAVAATYDGSHTDVWAVGSQSTPSGVVPLILRSTGGAWHRVSLPWAVPAGTYLRNVAATVGAHPGIWMIADEPGGAALVAHWQPGSWTKAVVPEPPAYDDLRSLATDSAGDVWVAGASGDYDAIPFVDRLSGGSWSDVPFPDYDNEQLITGLTAVSANDAWATDGLASECCDGESGIGMLHYSGGTWQDVGMPCPSDPNGNNDCEAWGLVAPTSSDSDIWAVGNANGEAAMWHYDGTGSSTTLYAPWNYPTGHSLFGATARGANDVWAVGNRVSETSTAVRTLIVHWNGTSWSDLGGPNGPTGDSTLDGITAAPHTGTLWAVGSTGGITVGSAVPAEPLILRHP